MFCRFCFIVCILLLNGFSSWSQLIHPAANRLIAGLKSQGVDSIIYFSSINYGRWTGQLCDSPNYLFWKENEKLYSQSIKSCLDEKGEKLSTSQSSIVRIDSTTVYDFLEEHFDSIFDSHLLPVVVKRNLEGLEFYEVPHSSHFIEYRFSLHMGDKEKSKTIRMDYLREELVFGCKNLNYSYNLSTPIWKFMDLLLRQTNELEEKKAYSFK